MIFKSEPNNAEKQLTRQIDVGCERIFTWASEATTKPNVKAICSMDGLKPGFQPPVVLAIPIATSKNVPRNSATSM